MFCYGSRARGDNQPFSDLDIMVEASVELSELISQLQEQLTNSNFPYKVDLVELKDFSESYQSGYQPGQDALVTRLISALRAIQPL